MLRGIVSASKLASQHLAASNSSPSPPLVGFAADSRVDVQNEGTQLRVMGVVGHRKAMRRSIMVGEGNSQRRGTY